MLMIVRISETHYGCLGALLKDGHPFCWTLEDHNKMLPIGDYKVVKKGNQVEIQTPGGSTFFTEGHTLEDADVNIILGFKIYSPRYISETKKAIEEFYKGVKNLTEDTLTIRRLS